MVLNVHTIKPLDRQIIEIAKTAGAVVTVEEHQVAGGLGSAICELLSVNCPLPTEMIGIHDKFGQSGEAKELYDHYGLSVAHIVEAIKKAAARKQR